MSTSDAAPHRDDENPDVQTDDEQVDVGTDPMDEPQLGPGKRRVVAPDKDATEEDAS